ncbi:hypothetical protein SAMN05216388_1011166 [Halorientalis persicus]|uniref:HEAT repeat-containing protein n=1 Tax=Halorientalis persicus TaxID=1367881 RepID=A0A1H8P6U7_9EURY|nr:hypothetical protein [Halorientalis persicus]SEO37464.1 hypothetical protein SAMN05216388_1011166 [Halorientalis persicus]
MGLRDWVFGGDETALEAANRLRGTAKESPEEVDVDRLVELSIEPGEHAVSRAAADGITALAEQRPDRLFDHVPELLEATTILEGVGSKQRGSFARALEHVAKEDPSVVAPEADRLIESLEAELEADKQPGSDVYIDPDKAAGLSHAAAAAGVDDATPVLERLRRHSEPTVSDAAREALREL